MKKILSIFLVSVILFGCNDNRQEIYTLTDKDGEYNFNGYRSMTVLWIGFDDKKFPTMYYNNEIYTGKGIEYYPDGQEKEEINFKNGILNGRYTYWYENGQIYSKQNYKDGKLIETYRGEN